MPQLSKRGTRDLICGLLQTVHRKYHDGTLVEGSAVFKHLVENLKEKLGLRISDLPREHIPKTFNGPATYGYPEKFINLIDQGFSLGQIEPMTELLRTSCAAIHKAVPKPTSQTLPSCAATQEFLESLTATLQKHHVSPIDAVRNMYVALTRNVLLGAGQPKPPRRPQGWAHRHRHCTTFCVDCKELDAFLRDPEKQTGEFRLAAPRRKHIEGRLPPQFFEFKTVKTRVPPHALVVTKRGTEFDEEMCQYDKAIRVFRDRVRFLQCPYVETLLGEELYSKVVMLEDKPASDGTEQREDRKTKAEEELDGPVPSRPRLIE